jgi:hypothetical protein
METLPMNTALLSTVSLSLAFALLGMAKTADAQTSGITFSNAAGVVSKKFMAGDEIYGKIILPKPLKDYVDGKPPKQMQINIKCMTGGITGIDVTKILRANEFDRAVIEFDVFPSLQKAKDVYDNNLGFYRTFYGTSVNTNKVEDFSVSFDSESYYGSGFKPIQVSGTISIDYSKVSKAQIDELYKKGLKITEGAEKSGGKLLAQDNAAATKALPLPIVFARKSQPGYTAYTNAQIISMIKSRYGVTEVYMLTFDKPEGSGDFTSLKGLDNYPTEKIGNHVFYFAFKDPTDGQFKFTGGRLRMMHEGNGKYSEPVIFPYSPLMNEDPKFPYDEEKASQGFASVFFMDGAKIKK